MESAECKAKADENSCLFLLLQSFASSLMLLCVVMVPMVMSGALLNTIASSTITKRVSESDTGTSLGLSMATHSMIRAVAPTLGGYMYSILGYASFGLLGFVLNGAMAIFLIVGADLNFLSSPATSP